MAPHQTKNEASFVLLVPYFEGDLSFWGKEQQVSSFVARVFVVWCRSATVRRAMSDFAIIILSLLHHAMVLCVIGMAVALFECCGEDADYVYRL